VDHKNVVVSIEVAIPSFQGWKLIVSHTVVARCKPTIHVCRMNMKPQLQGYRVVEAKNVCRVEES
jgi:hypothetical protein